MGRYDGKKVVIVGGSTGLGLVTAKLFVDEGARVLITGRTQATLDSAGAELGAAAVTVRSDAAVLSDIAALGDRVAAEFGSFDALFVNAGISMFAPLEEMTEQMYDEVFAINTKGPYFTIQRLAPLLTAGGGIVLTTSIVDEMGMALTSGYSATKAALRSMTRTLARELVPHGVRVNAVSPGPIDTGILEASLPREMAEQTRAQLTAENPMSRYGESIEVARAVAFLAFDATYTTGAELPVDGGRSQL